VRVDAADRERGPDQIDESGVQYRFRGKTDIEVEASLYTHRKSALVLINGVIGNF
jgi:hypothetical protein